MVTYLKQKAKKIDLENIWGRAVVAWYKRVLKLYLNEKLKKRVVALG